jgi:hypothetical protein
MKKLINYEPKKETLEEFPYVEIMEQKHVFADLPLAVVDFGKTYSKPVLYGNYRGVPTIYDESEVKQHLAKLKLFHFAEDQGKLTEVEADKATIHVRLPKETIVDQLIFKDGQIIWAKPVEEPSKEAVS